MKVVYNSCFGGFGLSKAAGDRLKELGVDGVEEHKFGGEIHVYLPADCPRHDSRLVQVVEELGAQANGRCADLSITDIYGDKYRINDYDGRESVIEPGYDDHEWITVK